MTFAELQTEVFTRLREESSAPDYWTAADVKEALNDGYEEMSDASEWYERNFPMPLLSLRTYYDLWLAMGGEAVLSLRAVFDNTTKRWLTPTDPRDLDYHTYPQWEQVQGEPNTMFLRGLRWLGLFPQKNGDSGTVIVYYSAMPPALNSGYQKPGFPEEYHPGIVEYALGDLLAQEQETEKSLGHFLAYGQHEAALVKWVDGRTSLDRINRLNG